MRINKFLADQGIASRRAIDALITKKRIAVNGVPLEKPGYQVKETDIITLDGKKISKQKKQNIVILFNKPAGCITTSVDPHGRRTVFHYIQSAIRIFPIGRLDQNTTGVLLLTNDGSLAHALMHPRHEVEKKYHARLDKPLASADKKRFEQGIILDGKKTTSCHTHFLTADKCDISIILHEGRNRQIHRMFNALGYIVQTLERISYAGLSSGNLKQGEWRALTEKEVAVLREQYCS